MSVHKCLCDQRGNCTIIQCEGRGWRARSSSAVQELHTQCTVVYAIELSVTGLHLLRVAVFKTTFTH